jgi:hypothetical protein
MNNVGVSQNFLCLGDKPFACQNVESYPELFMKGWIQGVDYAKLVPLLIEGIKEQQATIIKEKRSLRKIKIKIQTR